MKCKECNKETILANKYHKLCVYCNKKRLDQLKQSKRVNVRKAVKHSSNKRKQVLIDDKETYKKLFDSKEQVCENCGKYLPNEFEDENGNIIAIHRYSHIIPKSVRPDLRNNLLNFNILCLECHQKWEFGDRTKMVIFKQNELIKQKLRNG